MSFWTGPGRKHGSLFRFPLESRLDVPIWSRTDRTRLSLETNTSTTRAIFHSMRAAFSSHRRTTSFTQMFRRSLDHFCRLLMESRYSCLQRVQKMFAKYCTRRQRLWRYKSCLTKLPGGDITTRDFWVKRWFGDRGSHDESERLTCERGFYDGCYFV